MRKFIYLDNNATTKVAKEALKAMEAELKGPPSNPSSSHFLGQKAKADLFNAKDAIAGFLNVKPENLIFTSGGTEGANFAIKGLLYGLEGAHIISSDIDHSAIYNTLESLKERYAISYLNSGLKGCLEAEEIESEIRSDTRLIAVSAVNSETGIKTDIEKIALLAQRRGIHLVVDGVALLGKELFTIPKGVTSIFFSSHKLHGPKGAGLVYIKSGVKIRPLIVGGPQEFQKRAGTENLASILGFKEAVLLLKKALPQATKRMASLRDLFENELQKRLKNVAINGEGERICNTSNLAFEGIDGEALLILLSQRGVAASLGSACSSGSLKPSRVLLNMGYDQKRIRSSLRFSLCRFTTRTEIEKSADIIAKTVREL